MRRATVRRMRAGTSRPRWLAAALCLVALGATDARAEPDDEPVAPLALEVAPTPRERAALVLELAEADARAADRAATTVAPLRAPAWPWLVGAAAAFAAIVTVSVLVMTRDTATLEGDQELRVR